MASNDKARQRIEDKVLAREARLDPGDRSVEAKQIRATAASIRDHRTSPRRR
jgi:hypothetical protein